MGTTGSPAALPALEPTVDVPSVQVGSRHHLLTSEA